MAKSSLVMGVTLLLWTLVVNVAASVQVRESAKRIGRSDGKTSKLSPRIVIVSLFTPEAEVWYNIPDFDLLAINITIPGLSPLLPDAHCTADGQICQVITGEGEINAASTIMAFSTSAYFDLTSSYFLVAGIAGINPACGSTGSVSLAKYCVQVGLEYEVDARELEKNYTSGYIPLGAKAPDEYPVFIYGTEAFELNEKLRDRAFSLASSKAKLNDSEAAAAYRQKYPGAPANQPPTVIKGDTATSDVFFHGALLADAFSEYVDLLTNGSGRYCMTAQEDAAAMEAFVRVAIYGVVDFGRIMVMRTAANFDRPPPGESASEQLLYVNQGAFVESTQNIYLAAIHIVKDIVENWDSTYYNGIKPDNYIGDVFDSLKSTVAPDIGSPFFQTG